MNDQPPETPLPLVPEAAPLQHGPGWFKAKQRFYKYLIFWLSAFPLAIIIALLGRLIPRPEIPLGTDVNLDNIPSDPLLLTIVNIAALLLGIYGFIGWIPVLISGISWGKQK